MEKLTSQYGREGFVAVKPISEQLKDRGASIVTEKISSTVSYSAGVGTATAGALTLNDWALIVGIVVSLGTFAINWYYKHKTVKLLAKQNNADQHST